MALKIKIEQWQINKALELAKQGITKENICKSVNIGIRTYHKIKILQFKGQLNRTKKIEKMAIDFVRAIDTGYCDYFTTLEQVVYAGGLEDSKMALEILARRKSKEWGRKDYQKIDANVKNKNENLNIDLSKIVTEDDAKRLYEDLNK